jgi:hypothetical protein
LRFGRAHDVQENNSRHFVKHKIVRENSFLKKSLSLLQAPFSFRPRTNPRFRQGYPGGKVRPGSPGSGSRIPAPTLRNSLSGRGISGILRLAFPNGYPCGRS